MPPVREDDTWVIATCQRTVHVQAAAALPRGRAHGAGEGAELLRGEDAYALLLEIATGLKSAVAGETNVFGQLRRSWAEHAARVPPRRSEALGRIAEALFEDAARIRRSHLEGIGGSSYGTLARMLLRPRKREPVLFVGNGGLMNSMLPAFTAFEIGVYARDGSYIAPAGAHRFSPGEEAAAASWARSVIFCTPAPIASDPAWIAAFGRHPAVKVLHLGRRREAADGWRALDGVISLDDLFELSASQATLRRRRLEEARAACAAAADLRWARDVAVPVFA